MASELASNMAAWLSESDFDALKGTPAVRGKKARIQRDSPLPVRFVSYDCAEARPGSLQVLAICITRRGTFNTMALLKP